jgi:hypothetical protein
VPDFTEADIRRRHENKRYNERQKLSAALLNQVGTALLAAAVLVPIFGNGGRIIDLAATALAVGICLLLWYLGRARVESLRSED